MIIMILGDFQVQSKGCTQDNHCLDPIDDVCCFGECKPECPCREDADCPADKKMCCWYNGELYGQCLDVEECHCKCEKDSHCLKGYICCDGECILPEDCPCKEDKECPNNQICCDGECKPDCPCKENADCPANSAGDLMCCDGECVQPEDCPCERDSQCPEKYICCDGECRQPKDCDDVTPMECKFTNECPTDGDVCCKGYCVPPEKCPCQTVFDCPDIKHRCCKGQCLPPLNGCIYGGGCCNGECLPREECNDIFPK